MRPTSITSLYFEHEHELTEFLQSAETTAKELREKIVNNIKNRQGYVVTFKEGAPKALILRSVVDQSVVGTPDGDTIYPISFG